MRKENGDSETNVTPEDSDSLLSPVDRLDDLPRIARALRLAVRETLRDHKRAGNPVAVRRNGRVEWNPPEEIPDPPDESDAQVPPTPSSQVTRSG
jgi:hypothetical protein